MFSIQQRCVKSAFTTGAPGGTSGALIMYESRDMIGWKSDQSLSSAVLYWMREHMTAKMVDGEISGSLSSMACSRLSAVSFTPDCSDAKRSVFAVHSTITLSSLFAALKSRMSLRI